MKKSIWTKDINEKALPSLNEDTTCDILIIGGGIAGIMTAFNLKKQNVILIDKGKVGFGVTSKTTGKLTYLQGDIYSKIEKIYDFEMAKTYLESQVKAIKMTVDMIKKYNIDCDFQNVNSYIFENGSNNLDNERDFFKKANISYYNEDELPIVFPCEDAFYVKNTAVFHPLKFIMKIKNIVMENGVTIYENTVALDIDNKKNKYIVKTKNGNIEANKVIVCTHYPFFVVPGLMPFKLHQERSYVVVGKEENKLFSAINIDKPTYSVRFHNDYILMSGYSHFLSDKLDYAKEESKLVDFYKTMFSNEILYSWQIHDNMTTDYMPFIGPVNKKNPNLLIATGFNKWGMTNGILAGNILGDIVLGRKNKYIDIFSPSRTITLNKFINSVTNNFKIGKTYIGTKIVKPKMPDIFITRIDGNMCGVYIDRDNKKHVVKTICPHLKCNLVFNKSDLTWDCPCHGSRFDVDGNLLEGPSVYPIKFENTTKKI